MDGTQVPEGVGWTALLVAAQRARESARPDALFHDPLAAAVVAAAEAGREQGLPPVLTTDDGAPSPITVLMGDYLAVRTRFFDDYLRGAVRDGVDQVVILAAGMDARAHRLDRPAGVRVFEVDTPEVLTFKAGIIDATDGAAVTDRIAVAVDLRDDWPSALRAAGFDPSRPTAWLAEGLLIYLSADANDLLLTRIGELSAPGSRFGTEYTSGDPAASVGANVEVDPDDEGLTLFTALVDGGPPAAPEQWLPAHGWTPTTWTVSQWAAELGREAPPSMDADQGGMTSWLVTATRP